MKICIGKVASISKKEYDELSKKSSFPYIKRREWLAYVAKKQEKYTITYISTYIRPQNFIINLENQQMSVVLNLHNGVDIISKVFKMSVLTSSGLRELTDYGLAYSEKYKGKLLQYLTSSRLTKPYQYLYEKLGWDTWDGQPVFKTGEMILENQEESRPPAEYSGRLDLKPHGDLHVWLQMVRKEVLGNIPLTFVLLLGFASPILNYIGEENDLGCIYFNLNNSSSRGKTTSAKLAASVYSNPAIQKGTLVSYDSTDNAMIKFASECNGHTIVFDEVGTSSRDIYGFQKLFYRLCSGQDKMRLNADSTLQDTSHFSSVILSTAEFPILNENMPVGVRVRVFELSDDMTASAKSSDRIKAVISQNYALAGKEFTSFLFTKLGSMDKDYKACHAELMGMVKEPTSLTHRILGKLALVLLTARYVSECFSLDLQEEALKKYILRLERCANVQNSIEGKVQDCLREELSQNGNKYIWGKNYSGTSAIGRVYQENDQQYVAILRTKVQELFRQNNLDLRRTMRYLKEKNLLLCENDRQTKRVNLFNKTNSPNQISSVCYVFKLSVNLEQITDTHAENLQQEGGS